MAAGGASSGVATTSSLGFNLWATTTDANFKTTTFGGHISVYNTASSSPTDFIFGSGTDCNTDGGSAINPIWDSYSSTTGAVAPGMVYSGISSTSPKTVLAYYGYISDTAHDGTINDLNSVLAFLFGTSTTKWNTNVTLDSSGNVRTGTMIKLATSTAGKIGMVGQAFNFVGASSQCVQTGNVPSNTWSVMSVSAWINQSSYTTDDALAFELSNNSNTSEGAFLDLNASGGPRIQVLLKGNSGYSYAYFAVPTAGWHHYVAVYDRTRNGASVAEVDLYIDGVFQPHVSDTTVDNTGNWDTAYPVNIGCRGGASLFSTATIDNVQIYNRVLNAMDVKTIYNNTCCMTKFWTFGAEEIPTAINNLAKAIIMGGAIIMGPFIIP